MWLSRWIPRQRYAPLACPRAWILRLDQDDRCAVGELAILIKFSDGLRNSRFASLESHLSGIIVRLRSSIIFFAFGLCPQSVDMAELTLDDPEWLLDFLADRSRGSFRHGPH